MRIVLLALAACATPGGGEEKATKNELVSWSDEDGDTILDLQEGFVDPENEEGLSSTDSDGDGTADYLDLDSDDDGLDDAIEAGDDDVLTLPWDSDVDGVYDFRDDDSDANCIADADEGEDDLDGDGVRDFADLDDDADAILDTREIGEACTPPDSDGDGTADYSDLDSDGDGVGDVYEAGTSAWEDEPRDTDGDGTPDYLDADSDGDGFSDSAESGGGSPTDEPADTDGDGAYDFADSDSDGDAILDADEAGHGTDPYTADSDGDGFTDGAEVAAGTNPADSGSVIEGIYVTVPERTNVEEGFEFTLVVQRGDVGFVLDTTCTMTDVYQAMAKEYSEIAGELESVLPDAQYGYATYEDYVYGSMGSSGTDTPFTLHQQITDNLSKVQSALSATKAGNGGDLPESAMEAIYQAASGMGYDQDCDGTFDNKTDIRPFIASSSDAFGGRGGEAYDASDSSTGFIGGFGFRDYAVPIIVYATDDAMRDPDSSDRYVSPAPGGCPMDAGADDASKAVKDIGAYLIGISAGTKIAWDQQVDLAKQSGSYGDTDGDGAADDTLVYYWSGSSSDFRKTVVEAIEALVSSIQFSEVSLVVEGDTWGFVKDIEPDTYPISGDASGQVIDFQLTFRGAVAAAETDQVFKLTLNVVGDGTVLLDTLDIYVLVPGRAY